MPDLQLLLGLPWQHLNFELKISNFVEYFENFEKKILIQMHDSLKGLLIQMHDSLDFFLKLRVSKKKQWKMSSGIRAPTDVSLKP